MTVLEELKALLEEMKKYNYKYTQEEKIHIMTLIARIEYNTN